MADEIDQANDRMLWDTANCLSAVREDAARIPVGTAGDCDMCGGYTIRLVGGACAPCRDRYKLP